MSKVIKLKKGFNIKLLGVAEDKLTKVQPKTFAYKPTNFHGIKRPKLLVKEGDVVKCGSPILIDKTNEDIKHVSPVSGEVAEIRRGEKRKILEIVFLADSKIEHVEYEKFSASQIEKLTAEKITEKLMSSGAWLNIIERPYGVIANQNNKPKAIHISGFDTNPLAPDYEKLFGEQEKYFQTGVNVLKKLTKGVVHLNLEEKNSNSFFKNTKEVNINKFSGAHPCGNVGVQIHHIAPINKGDIVWTINPFGVIQIGKLFTQGIYDSTKIVALTGSEVINPQYYRTYIGASIKEMVKNNIKTDNVRYISGNVLTGNKIASDGYIGYYDNQVTVIPEGNYYEMFGWIKPSANKLSFHRAFGLLSFLKKNKEHIVDTNTKGELRAFVQSGSLEKVLPMDILPTFLIKAILAEDFDAMEELGIYEVIEEDMALCEFIDVSKNDIQKIIRDGLTLLQEN